MTEREKNLLSSRKMRPKQRIKNDQKIMNTILVSRCVCIKKLQSVLTFFIHKKR